MAFGLLGGWGFFGGLIAALGAAVIVRIILAATKRS